MTRLMVVLGLCLTACATPAHETARAVLAPPAALAPPCDPLLEIRPGLLASVRTQFDDSRIGPAPPMAPADIAASQTMQAVQQKRDWPNLCNFRADNLA